MKDAVLGGERGRIVTGQRKLDSGAGEGGMRPVGGRNREN